VKPQWVEIYPLLVEPGLKEPQIVGSNPTGPAVTWRETFVDGLK